MSHFTVLVTKTSEDYNDVKAQLEPFDEDRRMPKHISKTRADFIASGRKEVKRAKEIVAEYDADPAAYRAASINYRHIEWVNGEARNIAKIDSEDKLFELGSECYKDELDADGNYWSISNDDAKWDWYQVGGRWAGFFKPKAGATGEKGKLTLLASEKEALEHSTSNSVDVIKVKDIDWEAMDQAEKESRAKYFDEEMAKPENNRFIWADNRDSLLKMTKEDYTNRPVHHSTFAVLHDGRWYERGNMGWWGMVTNEKETKDWDEEWSKLVMGLNPETEVTVVDCHI